MYSLNEIDVTAKRAARGAGLPWGMAEEAGKCARWLEANGLPGSEAMLAQLINIDGTDCHQNGPDVGSEVWTAQSGTLCPLMTGAAISDHATQIAAQGSAKLGPVSNPLLLLPFVATTASRAGSQIEVSWQGTKATVTAKVVVVENGDTLTSDKAETVECRLVDGATIEDTANERCVIPASTWAELGKLGHRTFAPDTEASRLAGAGAGLSDND